MLVDLLNWLLSVTPVNHTTHNCLAPISGLSSCTICLDVSDFLQQTLGSSRKSTGELTWNLVPRVSQIQRDTYHWQRDRARTPEDVKPQGVTSELTVWMDTYMSWSQGLGQLCEKDVLLQILDEDQN